MSDIKITYETLFDLLRRERNRDELQTLDSTFYHDVLTYLAEKKALMDEMAAKDHISSETEKARIQFHNIKKILKEFYDRREKKIILLAMNAVRTGSQVVDTKLFLPEEHQAYQELITLLQKHRREILQNVLHNIPPKHDIAPSLSTTQPTEKPAEQPEKKPPEKETTMDDRINLKFIKSVPRFAGENKEIFGPFATGDEAALPPRIAQVLLKKGRAEQA